MQREALLAKAAMHITPLINTGETIRKSHQLRLVADESCFSLQIQPASGLI